MQVLSTPSWKQDTNKQSVSLVIPDYGTDYAMRYVWMQHRFKNEEFVNNYFTIGNNLGMNVRKQTVKLQAYWNKHNAIFDDSGKNGDLIWRVKVLNLLNDSIDYIEVWKSSDIIYSLLEDNSSWPGDSMNLLKQGIYDAGFSAQKWLPFPTVSKDWAHSTYNIFLKMTRENKKCIINTPMHLI